MIQGFLILFSILFATQSIQAKELKGVTFPDDVKVEATTLKLNGIGIRKAYNVLSVYMGALYLVQPSKDENTIVESTTPKRIVLHFLMGVEKDKMQDAWKEGFSKNAASGYSYRTDLNKLNGLMANMKKEEHLTFTFFSDRVEVLVKDRPAETIAGADFSKTMLKVFIKDPPDSGLKKGMLGLD